MGVAFALFAALFLGLASASGEVMGASLHNKALAPFLLGAANACGVEEREGSEGGIFEVSEIRIVALIPQVGNATSDLANASLLWSYSAKAPKKASFPLRSEKCPDGKIEYYNPTEISLSSARLAKAFCGKESEMALEIGKNPLPLLLGECNGSRGKLYEPLALGLAGRLSVRYSYRKDYYEYGCLIFQNGTACGCQARAEFGMRTFEKEVSHQAGFDVEVGKNSWLWLSPPLGARLDGAGKGKLLLFAKRMPSELALYLDGQEASRAFAYRYNVSDGKCGEKTVERVFSPQGDFFLNASESALEPYQLLERNDTVLPFYIEFDFGAEAGKREVALLENDSFGFSSSHARNFTVRAPARLSPVDGEPGGIAIREGSGSETPSASKSPPPAPRKSPWIALLASLLLLPFALGAHSILRRRENES